MMDLGNCAFPYPADLVKKTLSLAAITVLSLSSIAFAADNGGKNNNDNKTGMETGTQENKCADGTDASASKSDSSAKANCTTDTQQ